MTEVRRPHERRENDHVGEHDDRILDGRLTRRPRDLFELLANLTKELTGAGTFFGARRGGRLATLRNRVAFAVDVARALQHASLLAIEGHGSLELVQKGECATCGHAYPIGCALRRVSAGQEGLEPPTCGFGDRCSAS